MSKKAASDKWATYVDGFNFYYAIKERSPKGHLPLGWCDFAKLSEKIIDSRGELTVIKYFTASVQDFPKHEFEPGRQDTWLRAARTIPKLAVVEGFFVGKKHGTVASRRSEKATDVNIAVTLVLDGAKHVYDRAILITGDYDQMPAVATVANELYKSVEVWIPPGQNIGRWGEFDDHPRVSVHRLTATLLRGTRLPDRLSDVKGPIEPPDEWQSKSLAPAT